MPMYAAGGRPSTSRIVNNSGERQLAGRVAGSLWLTGAFCAALGLLLPGAVTKHWGIVLGLAGFGAVWGIATLLIPWERASQLAFHLPSVVGLAITAAAVAATGGSRSPYPLLLVLIIAYAAYFYPPREAAPYVIACVAVHALPLLYDEGAVDRGLIGEVLVAGPCYAVLGGVIMAGKRRLVRLEETARELSRHDPLTGVCNRRAFIEAMEEHVGGKRGSDVTGLLLVDIDDFKDVNTLHGHPAGDRVLVETACALTAAARGDDTVARLGGDEFAIVATCVGVEAMRALAERVLAAIRETGERLALPGFRLTASSGWALYPDNARTVDELVACADVSLRRAKVGGKDRVQPPLAAAN